MLIQGSETESNGVKVPAVTQAPSSLDWNMPFWPNVIVIALFWIFVYDDLSGNTFGWWGGTYSSFKFLQGIQHSGAIFVLLAIPVTAMFIFAWDICCVVAFIVQKAPIRKSHWLFLLLLLVGLIVTATPADSLRATTVAVLGPGKNGIEHLRDEADRGHLRTVKALLNAGVPPDSIPGPRSRSDIPLHLASLRGNLEIMTLLIDKGANVNAKDSSGKTPLHWAAEHRQVKATELLLNHGAKTEIEDAKGQTPLMLARALYEIMSSEKRPDEETKTIIQLLESKPSARNSIFPIAPNNVFEFGRAMNLRAIQRGRWASHD